jgi:hypothetical protein
MWASETVVKLLIMSFLKGDKKIDLGAVEHNGNYLSE